MTHKSFSDLVFAMSIACVIGAFSATTYVIIKETKAAGTGQGATLTELSVAAPRSAHFAAPTGAELQVMPPSSAASLFFFSLAAICGSMGYHIVRSMSPYVVADARDPTNADHGRT